MNKIASRITAAVMAAAMTLGFSSCGRREAAIASKEHVYSSQKLEMPEGLTDLNWVLYGNGKLFLLGSNSWTEGEGENQKWLSETKMQILNLDGAVEKEIMISPADEDTSTTGSRYLSSAIISENGNLVGIEQVHFWNEETYESRTDYYLVRYDDNGTMVSESSLEKIKEATGQDWLYVYNFVESAEGEYLILSDNVVYATNDRGELLYTIKNDDSSSDNAWIGEMVKAGDGRVFVRLSTWKNEGDNYTSENYLVQVDIENRQFGEKYPLSVNGTLMNGTDKYDLLISKDSGLVGYDVETGEAETIIDWLKSGIDTTAMVSNGVTVMPDGRILCITYNYNYTGGGGYGWSSNDQVINILTEIDPATLPDKKLIKMYALYLNLDIKRQILEFNKNSLEYEIELTSYDDYAMNSYDDAITRINNDMISGNLPDIIVLSDSMPTDSYIAKGLLANIYNFMDKDDSINRDEFLTSVFEAYEIDGKLYEVIPTFTVNTIVGKASQVGTETGWTMDEFIEFVDSNSDASVFGNRYDTKSSMLSNFISYNYRNFVNRETGKCSFDSDDFIKLLEFCNRFPKEYNYEKETYDDNYWNEYQARYRNGKALLNMAYISRFGAIREIEQGQFGEAVTFKGFPGNDSGSSISAYTSIAITSKAANPDGAWEFVKYFYSEEYQDQYGSNESYEFPVRLSSLEKQAEASKTKPGYEDPVTGEWYEYGNSYWIGDTSVDIGVNTDEDNARMMDLLKSIKRSSRYDREVYKIVTEEADAYFNGQKSAKEVADIIQNRVSNYVAESR